MPLQNEWTNSLYYTNTRDDLLKMPMAGTSSFQRCVNKMRDVLISYKNGRSVVYGKYS